MEILEYLRELNMASIGVRMGLGLLFGGIIGMERGSKHRAAGFRTYMLVCMGAVLTMLLGQYQQEMLKTAWAEAAERVGAQTDVSRFGAQVINGIGFLGAGTIIVTGRQEVKGLTTGAGLWACACMGLAIGAGFYECVLLAFGLIAVSIRLLPRVEAYMVEHARNVNLYVEFESRENVAAIVSVIKSMDAQIYQVEMERGREETGNRPSAVIYLRLKKRHSREKLLVNLSALSQVYNVELI